MQYVSYNKDTSLLHLF